MLIVKKLSNKRFFALLGSVILLHAFYIATRNLGVNNAFTLHISNATFTCLIVLVVFEKRLRKSGFSVQMLWVIFGVFALINLLVELVTIDTIPLPSPGFEMTFANFNTADPFDAIWGIAGLSLLIVAIYYLALPYKPDVRRKRSND